MLLVEHIAAITVLMSKDEPLFLPTHAVREFQVVASEAFNRFFVFFGEGDDALVDHLAADGADPGWFDVHDHGQVVGGELVFERFNFHGELVKSLVKLPLDGCIYELSLPVVK